VAVVDKDNKVTFHKVTIVRDGGNAVEISSGVAVGDKIALNISSQISSDGRPCDMGSAVSSGRPHGRGRCEKVPGCNIVSDRLKPNDQNPEKRWGAAPNSGTCALAIGICCNFDNVKAECYLKILCTNIRKSNSS
jgi:hypothetical protein